MSGTPSSITPDPPPEHATRIQTFLTEMGSLPVGARISGDKAAVHALADIAALCRAAVLTVAHERSCVFTVRVLDLVLAHYAVPSAAPAAATVTAANSAAVACLDNGLPMDKWPAAAYNVGVLGTGDINGKNWDGHLVTVIRTRGPRILIDPSSGQFDRPAHGLQVPPVVCGPLPSVWSPEDLATFTLSNGTRMEYGLSLSKAWKTAKDWDPNREGTRMVVQAVVDKITSLRELRLARTPDFGQRQIADSNPRQT